MEIPGRTFSRRTLLKGTAAGVGAASLLGAGARPRRLAAQSTAEVRLTGWASSPAEEEALRQTLTEFETANPTIKVNYEPVSGDYAVKLQTDLAAGNAADVFYVDALVSQDLMSREVLLPIDDLMAEAGVTAEDFYPGPIQAFQWQGSTFGLPKDASPLAMVYNQDMFAQAEITTPPTTWEELRTAAQRLKDATGLTPIVYGASFDRFIAFLYQAGARVTNPEATEVTLDDPKTVEALEFYYGLYNDGLAAQPPEVGADWAGGALAQELTAIAFEGNWFWPFAETDAPDIEFGVAEMPAGSGGTGSPVFTVSYSIAQATTVADAAWTLVSYLTGPDGMKNWTGTGIAMPSRPDLAEWWGGEFPERQPYLATLEYAIPWQFGPGGQKFNADANAIIQNLFAGSIDAEQAKDQLVEKATADLQLGQ